MIFLPFDYQNNISGFWFTVFDRRQNLCICRIC